jgi:hypothetical protein
LTRSDAHFDHLLIQGQPDVDVAAELDVSGVTAR